jgi:4-aminobutyrate aminotransferase-like enzyme
VGDVRGKGLMIGVEMVEDKVTKVPLRPQAMLDIWDRTKEAGVLIGEYIDTVIQVTPLKVVGNEK